MDSAAVKYMATYVTMHTLLQGRCVCKGFVTKWQIVICVYYLFPLHLLYFLIHSSTLCMVISLKLLSK